MESSSEPRLAPGPIRFDEWSDSGRRMLGLAQDEAIGHDHSYIGTEHLLLALIRDRGTLAGRALTALGAGSDRVREATETIIGRGETAVSDQIGITPRAQRVILLATDEARGAGGGVGPEYVLFAILREGEGIAGKVLRDLDVTLDRARAEVASLRKVDAAGA